MVTKINEIEHQVMEPRVTGDSVSYIEKTIKGFAWMCEGCNLVWAKRWYAETCSDRNHKPEFEQHYGGYIENGARKGGTSYTRISLGRMSKST